MDTPSGSTRTHHYLRTSLVAIVGWILIIIIVVILANPISRLPTTIENFFKLVPLDARGLAVREGGPNGSIFLLGTHGLTQVSAPKGEIVLDFASGSEEGEQYVITQSPKGADDIENLTTHSALTTDGKPKSALAVSADGVWIAYSELASTTLTIPATATNSSPITIPIDYSSDLSAWVVKAMNTQTGATLTLGTGYGPQFVGKNFPNLILFSSTGKLNTYNLVTGLVSTTPWQAMTGVSTSVQLSDDGTKLFSYDPVAHTTQMFTVESGDLHYISYESSLPQGVFSVVGKNGALYGLEQVGSSTALWKGDTSGKGSPIYTFNAKFVPNALLP